MTVSTYDGQIYEDAVDYHLNNPVNGDTTQRTSQFTNSEDDNKKIYYVRHGDTDLNTEGGENSSDQPVRGWSQVSLNEDGRNHAKKAAKSVEGLPIEHIVSSDLPRAAQTARIISKQLDIPVEYDPGLRTWDLGAYTGKAGKETHDAVNKLCLENQDEKPPSNSQYQGESFNEFKNRVLSTVSDITQRHNDKEILLVSHNSPERVLHAWTEAGQPHKTQRMAGDLTPLSEEDKIELLKDTPSVSRRFLETPSDVQETMDITDEEAQKQYEDAVESLGKENVIPNNPLPTGRIVTDKDNPAVQEYLKRLPDDTLMHDIGNGRVIIRKKPGYKPPLVG